MFPPSTQQNEYKQDGSGLTKMMHLCCEAAAEVEDAHVVQAKRCTHVEYTPRQPDRHLKRLRQIGKHQMYLCKMKFVLPEVAKQKYAWRQ